MRIHRGSHLTQPVRGLEEKNTSRPFSARGFIYDHVAELYSSYVHKFQSVANVHVVVHSWANNFNISRFSPSLVYVVNARLETARLLFYYTFRSHRHATYFTILFREQYYDYDLCLFVNKLTGRERNIKPWCQ